MTVKELIEILQTLPQDLEIYRLNTEEDRWFSDHTEAVSSVEVDEKNQEVVLK